MSTVLLTKAGRKGWEQIRVPSHQVVRLIMKGYHLVPHSTIITKP